MARQREPKAFGSRPGGGKFASGSGARPVSVSGAAPRVGKRARGGAGGSQVIPDAVAGRMARRIAIATGVPSLLGMGVIVASYLLVSRGIAVIEPVVTLVASGAFFLLGLLGLSYGVLSASWEEGPGSLLGLEQIGVNIGRIRESVRAMRQGGGASG